MTGRGTWIVEGDRAADPLRRVVLGALALYLAPAALVVLLIGCLGMACCAALRLVGGTPRHVEDRPRRDGPGRAVGRPHLGKAARIRSRNR